MHLFDLAQGPLLRTILLRLDEEEAVLLITMQRIICDDWSLRIFMRELAVHYQALSAGKPSPLPELTVQYADFVQWQREQPRSSAQGATDLLETAIAWSLHDVATACRLSEFGDSNIFYGQMLANFFQDIDR